MEDYVENESKCFSSQGFSSALFLALGLTFLVSCGGKPDTNPEFVSQVTKNITAEIGATLDDSLVSHFVMDINQFFENHKIPQNQTTLADDVRYGAFDFRDFGKKDLVLKLYTHETLKRNIAFLYNVLGKDEEDFEHVSLERMKAIHLLIERMKKILEELKNEIEADAGMPIEEFKKELGKEKQKRYAKKVAELEDITHQIYGGKTTDFLSQACSFYGDNVEISDKDLKYRTAA